MKKGMNERTQNSEDIFPPPPKPPMVIKRTCFPYIFGNEVETEESIAERIQYHKDHEQWKADFEEYQKNKESS